MQTISSMNPARAPRRIIAIFIGILSVLMFASCGGGGSTDPNATAQSVEDGTKTIQAVPGSTAVPGTWTGRAPKMEVINGITVPPEPAPTINNATLAGIDVNNNGVRDDVEREIAKKLASQPKYDAVMKYAKSYQETLNAPAPTSRQAALQRLRALMCSSSGSTGTTEAIRWMQKSNLDVEAALFNTSERRKKLDLINKQIGAYDGEELLCD